MATTQVKNLKRVLKQIGAVDSANPKKSPRANVESKQYSYYDENGVRKYYREYGEAISLVKPLTDEQVAKLKELDPYAKVQTYFAEESYGFTVVRS